MANSRDLEAKRNKKRMRERCRYVLGKKMAKPGSYY